jgi:predicted nucleic acid-binding protein
MSGKAFLDTNIFVYAYDDRDARKHSRAVDLIRQLTVSGDAVISYQVVQEFFNVALTKSSKKLNHHDAHELLEDVFRPLLAVPSSFSLVSEAIRIQDRYRLSWYDSLIASAAQQAGCDVLYSEDLQHGQQFGPVTVQNPFL